LLKINKREKVSALEDYATEVISEAKIDFNNAMGQESLTRFDQQKRRRKTTRNHSRDRKQKQ
jgi:hypothetical protein